MASQSDTNYDHAIFQGWARGVSVQTLASSFDRQVEEVDAIVRTGIDNRPRPSQVDPEECIREHFIKMEALVEELAVATPSVTDMASIRAMHVRAEIQKHLFGLRQELGLLPNRK